MALTQAFTAFAGKVARWAGHPLTFSLGAAVVLVLAISGPYFGYSET